MFIHNNKSLQKEKNIMARTHFFSYFLLAIVTILCVGFTTHATNDDPGRGRLSGENIPAEFYDMAPSDNNITLHNFHKYGVEKTESPYTEKEYFHRSDLVERPITHGIDVSYYQGEIDWNKVKADGIDFAIIRVGYRGSSEGTLNEDICFRQNIEGALEAGVEVGVYIFSQAITKKEARQEANYILKRIKDYDITFPVVLDYEFTGNPGRLQAANLSKKKATNICLEFCDTVEAAGYTPMVYANPYMLNNYLNPEDISDKYLIWLAHYTTETNYTGQYDYWQYSSDGSVDGIEGRVDMNFFYGTDIAKCSISPIAEHIYTGNRIRPAVTVMNEDKTLINGTDYTIKYSNNKKVGVATVTVTGEGVYYGSQSTEFNIKPKQMSSVKAKRKSDDSITLSWEKDSSITGYQLYRATAVNGKYEKCATITDNATTTYKDSNLLNGQCYYYKIRGYKKVNGKNWYGAFSEISSIYTKTGYTRNASAKKNAAIYENPAISETPIITPAKNDTMAVVYATKDKSGNTWYRITYKKKGKTYRGFVNSQKVIITKLGKVTGNKVNVRKSYSTSAKKITMLNKNKKVTILKTKKRKGATWYKIQFKKNRKTYKGWICADYVKLI